jgi:hypothetical protein
LRIGSTVDPKFFRERNQVVSKISNTVCGKPDIWDSRLSLTSMLLHEILRHAKKCGGLFFVKHGLIVQRHVYAHFVILLVGLDWYCDWA